MDSSELRGVSHWAIEEAKAALAHDQGNSQVQRAQVLIELAKLTDELGFTAALLEERGVDD